MSLYVWWRWKTSPHYDHRRGPPTVEWDFVEVVGAAEFYKEHATKAAHTRYIYQKSQPISSNCAVHGKVVGKGVILHEPLPAVLPLSVQKCPLCAEAVMRAVMEGRAVDSTLAALVAQRMEQSE